MFATIKLKIMKKLLTSAAFLTVVGLTACNQPAKTETADAHWSMTLDVTPNSSKHALDSVAAAWAKDSVTLKFTNLKYDSLNKLTKFEGTVNVISKGRNVDATFSEDSSRSMEINVDDNPGVFVKRI
jgi:ABC-type glycerol-3-phosphate transport system substrate-binding protein